MRKITVSLLLAASLTLAGNAIAAMPTASGNQSNQAQNTKPMMTPEEKMASMAKKMKGMKACRMSKKLMWMGVRLNMLGQHMKSSANDKNAVDPDKLVALGKEMFNVGYQIRANMNGNCRWTHKRKKMCSSQCMMRHKSN